MRRAPPPPGRETFDARNEHEIGPDDSFPGTPEAFPVLSKDVETGDLRQALVAAFSLQNLATSVLFAYSFYAPRYMRTKLLEAGRSLPALMPEKEGGFRTTFRGVSSIRRQVATWIVFLAALLLAL